VAVVVDEYGGTSGLVRLSDLVEALMGSPATGSWRDLEKETLREGPAGENAAASSLAKGPSTLAFGGRLLDARTSVRALGNLLGMDLTEVAGLGGPSGSARPVTVGGLVTALLGRWPVVGDQVECRAADGERKLRFTVTEMRGRRLTKVQVDLLAEGEEGGNRPPLSSI
jgi:CBS domain containing-hemolysin-like protein